MFEANSRYANRPVVHVIEGGREVPHAARRFIIDDDSPPIGQVLVRQSDRADHLAHEAYGDPTQWWRLADRAHVAGADELTDEVGARLDVPAPGANREVG